MFFKKFITSLTFAIIFALPFQLEAQSKEFKVGKGVEVLINTIREIEQHFVDSVEVDSLLLEATRGALERLDPYTTFISDSERDNLEMLTTGSYGGIGATIRKEGERVLIAEVHEKSPAAKGGIEDGDYIIAIDGESVAPLKVDQCSAKMRGVAGSEVIFTILKGRGEERVEMKIVREKVHLPNVPYYGVVEEGVGYIAMSGFAYGSAKEVRRALIELKERGPLKRLILDLRDNGGGLMDEAIELASLFLPQGREVVSSNGRLEGSRQSYNTVGEPIDTLLPLAILVNSSTASSSEIVAGALQDYKRATIIGEKSFGKGLVQSIRDVGYNNKIKITTAKYYTPLGRSVQGIDYGHRDEQGRALSLNGGGGLSPDIKSEPQTYSRPVLALLYGEHLHSYSLLFYRENLSIETPDKFQLGSEEYNKFVEWASEREFDHRTATEIEFDKLLKVAEMESIQERIKVELERLEKSVRMDKREVLLSIKEEIKPLLEEEIVRRYYYQRGAIESALRVDPQVKFAAKVELIN